MSESAAETDIDVIVLQRPKELDRLAECWTGRRPGRDLPAVYLEHNAPDGPVDAMVHPARDRPDVTVVHVTHFNQLFWDTGRARSVVGKMFRPLETWRDLVPSPMGEAIDCGHFIPEEKPDETLRALRGFFRA